MPSASSAYMYGAHDAEGLIGDCAVFHQQPTISAVISCKLPLPRQAVHKWVLKGIIGELLQLHDSFVDVQCFCTQHSYDAALQRNTLEGVGPLTLLLPDLVLLLRELAHRINQHACTDNHCMTVCTPQMSFRDKEWCTRTSCCACVSHETIRDSVPDTGRRALSMPI